MEFTKSKRDEISKISIDALTKVLEPLGIKVERAGGSYDTLEYTMKIRLSCSNVDGDTQAQNNYKTYATFYDLPLEMLGTTFKLNGRFFTVTGFLPNRPKNNIQIENAKGKKFIAPHETVVRAYQKHVASTTKVGA